MGREHGLREVEESLFMFPSCLLLSTGEARRQWWRKQFYRVNVLLATAHAIDRFKPSPHYSINRHPAGPGDPHDHRELETAQVVPDQ